MPRLVDLRNDDVVMLNGYEISFEVLAAIITPEARLLWAFIKDKGNRIQPVAYGEEKVIWIEASDLEQIDAS